MAIRQYISGKDVAIKSMKELRQDKENGSTLEAVFDLKGSGLGYKTANNFALFPENDVAHVKAVADRLGFNLNDKFVFEPNVEGPKSQKHPFPTPVTVNEALTKFTDLIGPLSKKQLKELAEYATNAEEKQKLKDYSTSKDLQKELQDEQVGLIDLLDRFQSLKLNMDSFF